jgi:hypothetical protein
VGCLWRLWGIGGRPTHSFVGDDTASYKATAGRGENHAQSVVGGAEVGRGGTAGGRVPAGSVLGGGFACRVGGVG